MGATEDLAIIDPALRVELEEGGPYHWFKQTDCKDVGDPSGIACEEGEALYGLIRMLRPAVCVETGTNTGIAARYITLALCHNETGRLTTVEHDERTADRARSKLSHVAFEGRATVLTAKTLEIAAAWAGISNGFLVAEKKPKIDLLWLDSEPDLRFRELALFWPALARGAVIGVHDLPGLPDERFGQLPLADAKGDPIKLRYLTFRARRGFTIMQRVP